MVITHHKLLHYVLIVLLMFAPLRGVVAMQDTHCDMDEMSMSSSSADSSHEMMVSDEMHIMSSIDADALQQESGQSDHQCCCCEGADCAANCDLGTVVSLVLQQSSYVPLFKDVSESISVSQNILIRELTPPSRPPATLYN